jgi:hypothetical protein
LKIAYHRPVATEAQAVPYKCPQQRNQRHQREALHHGGQHVFPPHQPAVKQRQAGTCHHQHQRGADQHPGVVT